MRARAGRGTSLQFWPSPGPNRHWRGACLRIRDCGQHEFRVSATTEYIGVNQFVRGNRMEQPIHPLWLRVMHWLNAFAVLILVTSGWRIYNASPLFDF